MFTHRCFLFSIAADGFAVFNLFAQRDDLKENGKIVMSLGRGRVDVLMAREIKNCGDART